MMLRKIGDLLQRTVAFTGFTVTAVGTLWLGYVGYKIVMRRKGKEETETAGKFEDEQMEKEELTARQ